MLEMLDSLPWLRALIVGGVALGAVAILLNREREVHRAKGARGVAVGAVLAAALVVAFVGWRVIDPPPALAEWSLTPGMRSPPSLPLPQSGTELIVHGKLGADGRAQGEGHYALRVLDGDTELARFDGKLSRDVQTRKYMRRGRTQIAVEHTEGTHVLPAAAAGRAVQVEVTRQDGKLTGPLGVALIPAPPRELPLLVTGLLLTIAATILDKSTKAAKSWLGLGVAMLFAFALLLLEAPHPLPVSHLARSVPVAAVGGGLVGALVRGLVGLFVRKPAAKRAA